MVKILTFPERRLDTPHSQHVESAPDFLVFDSDGTLSFSKGPAEESKQSAAPEHATRDWTNQELANIYRVKHILDAAQIPTELDRGLSDEGDPWCVFCTVESDVFIHLSRIDGLYWLDSPKLPAPLNGFSFDELVHGFINLSETDKQSTEMSAPKIVRFKKNNTVFLHPSVMLAALVWSLYFDSDELLIPSTQENIEDTPKTAEFGPWSIEFDQALAQDGLRYLAEKVDDKQPFLDGEEVEAQKSATASGGGHFPFSVTLGLGSIAVASGLILESQWKEVVRTLFTAAPEENLEADPSASVDVSSLTTLLLQSLDSLAEFIAGGADEEAIKVADNTTDQAGFDAAIEELIANLVELAAVLENARSAAVDSVQQEADIAINSPEEGFSEHAVLAGVAEPHVGFDVHEISAEQASQSATILGLMDAFFGNTGFKTLHVGGTTYLADLSVDQLTSQSLDLVEQVIYEADTGSNLVLESQGQNGGAWNAVDALPLFDKIAQEFVFGLFEHSDTMKVILSQKDLVFFDLAAYKPGEERVQMTWDTGDGGTISLLGTKADFAEFGFA